MTRTLKEMLLHLYFYIMSPQLAIQTRLRRFFFVGLMKKYPQLKSIGENEYSGTDFMNFFTSDILRVTHLRSIGIRYNRHNLVAEVLKSVET